MTKTNLILAFCLFFSLTIQAQIINFPDPVFKQALIDRNIDTNGDGEIEMSEAEVITLLMFQNNNFSDATGVSFFKNLTTLVIENTGLLSLDVSELSKLEYLDCRYNSDLEVVELGENISFSAFYCWQSPSLTSVNHDGLIGLKTLWFQDTPELSDFDISEFDSLQNLTLHSSKIKVLDLSDLSLLERIEVGRNDSLERLTILDKASLDFIVLADLNSLSSVDLGGLPSLEYIELHENISLTKVNIISPCSIQYFKISDNIPLSELDLSNCSFSNLECYAPLIYLNIANGIPTDAILVNPNILEYLCVDDEAEKLWFLTKYPQATTLINLNCNVFPFGDKNWIKGKFRFEETGDCNGSNAQDVVTQMIFRIKEDGIDIGNVGAFIRNDSFEIFIKAGDFEIIPDNNADLFVIEPDTINVVFLDTGNTVFHDFCLNAFGAPKVDIEAKLIPLDIPRAGFETKYKIVFSNLGNTPSSGEVYMNYHDPEVQFVSADLPVTDDGVRVTHNYIDLKPFESRELIVTMRLNSPMDTPPLNTGDYIGTAIAAVPLEDDYNLDDNYTSLREEVVNAYDPNDKQCLQGEFISAEIAGNEVDYLIRFENSGNGNAISITVTDTLNEAMFDPSTVRVTDASHSVYMQQRGNFVEFIFEDINLPFDDDNNDGYVAFSVKTKDNLVVGDSLLNNADIFFDFNWPIRTNTATSVLVTDLDMDGYHNLEDCDDNNAAINPGAIDIPGNGIDEDCNGSDATSSTIDLAEKSLELYPNPATHILYAKRPFNGSVTLRSIDGKVMLSALMQNSKLDISGVPGGFYFLELHDALSDQIFIEKIVIDD